MDLSEIKSKYPIVIVGGGLVGATLAIALKQIHLEVLVIEAFAVKSQQQPSFDDRTVALSQASLQFLHKLGLYDLVSDWHQPIKKIHVSDQGHYGFARIDAQDYGFEALGSVVENWRLGQVLLSRLQQLDIDYCCPAEVVAIEQNTEQTFLEVKQNGESKKIAAGLIMLADGARSPLRRQLHFDAEITDYQTSAIVCNIKTQQAHNDWAFERFTDQGPLALLPLNHNRISVVWSRKNKEADELLNLDKQVFAKKLEQTFGSRLGKIVQVGQRKKFPLIQLVSGNTIKGRCLLMGNSAQSLHPIAGQGLNLALRDISALQSFFNEKLSEKQVFDPGNYTALSEYQKRRVKDRQQTINITETLARLFSNQWAPLSISRNLMLKIMDVTPVLKETFASQAMGFKS